MFDNITLPIQLICEIIYNSFEITFSYFLIHISDPREQLK